MNTQDSSSLSFLFFLVPIVLPILVGAVLQRLSENLGADGAPAKKISSRERAGEVADQHAMKVQRERARRQDGEASDEAKKPAAAAVPAAALAEGAPMEFEIPADFNLAEYSGRDVS